MNESSTSTPGGSIPLGSVAAGRGAGGEAPPARKRSGAGGAPCGATLGTIARISSLASQCGTDGVLLGGSGGLPPGVGEGSGGGSEAGRSLPPAAPQGQGAALVRRFWLQSYARDLFKKERVAICLRRPVPGRSIDVLYSPAARAGHYGGLQVCASVWLCPVCASKVSERRRVELGAGVESWLARPGRPACVLVTLTLQHDKGQNLGSVLALVKRAYGLLRGGKWWVAFVKEAGIAGSVRSLEVTHGSNGWHPHMHVLFFLEGPPPVGFADTLKRRWMQCVASDGGFASYDHGCDVRLTDMEVADYVAKYGREPAWTVSHEVTKAPSKVARAGGRTAFQLLADYAGGDERAGTLFLLYGCSFKGQRQLYWSKGLRALLGLVEEVSDEELAAAQDEMAVVLASLSAAQWRAVLGNDARADLLLVASTGDAGAVRAFLADLGV
jgi:hypothetical protein